MIIIKLKYSKLRSYCTVYTATPSHLRTYLKLHIQYTYTTHNQYTYESESESILWGSRSLNLRSRLWSSSKMRRNQQDPDSLHIFYDFRISFCILYYVWVQLMFFFLLKRTQFPWREMVLAHKNRISPHEKILRKILK